MFIFVISDSLWFSNVDVRISLLSWQTKGAKYSAINCVLPLTLKLIDHALRQRFVTFMVQMNMIKFRSVDDLTWRFPTLFEIRNENGITEGTAELSNTSDIYLLYLSTIVFQSVHTRIIGQKSVKELMCNYILFTRVIKSYLKRKEKLTIIKSNIRNVISTYAKIKSFLTIILFTLDSDKIIWILILIGILNIVASSYTDIINYKW